MDTSNRGILSPANKMVTRKFFGYLLVLLADTLGMAELLGTPHQHTQAYFFQAFLPSVSSEPFSSELLF